MGRSVLLGITLLFCCFTGCGERVLVLTDPDVYDPAKPDAITLFTPRNYYASTNREPLFSWSSYTSYAWRLLVSTNTNFSFLLHDEIIGASATGNWIPSTAIPTNQTVFWKVIGTAGSSSNCSQINTILPPPGIRALLITEWADAGTNLDYIELRNFGEEFITIQNSLQVFFNNSYKTLTQWGTGTNIAAYIPFSTSVSIAPGEIILIVESDVTTASLSNLQAWGMPSTIKIFLSDDTTLIGTTADRLSATCACLTNGDGRPAWSITPDPAAFSADVGSSTYSGLREGFMFFKHVTSDTYRWKNGTATSLPRSPGVWP